MSKKLLLKEVIFISVIILFTGITSILINDNLDLYFVDYLIKSISAFAFFIILIYSLYNDEREKNTIDSKDMRANIYKVLAICYGALAVILLMKTILFYESFAKLDLATIERTNSIINMKILNSIYYLLEITFLFYVLISYIKERVVNSLKAFYVLISIIIISYPLLLATEKINTYIISTFYIRDILIVSGYIALIFFVIKIKGKFLKYEYQFFVIYLSLKVLYFILTSYDNGTFTNNYFYVIESLYILFQYKIVRYLTFELMINPQIRLNEQLKELNFWQESLITNLPDPVLIRNDDKVIYTNEVFNKTFKFKDVKDIMGKNINDIFSENDIKYIRALEKELREHKQIITKRYEYTVNGNKIEVEESAMYMKGNAGNTYLFISRDLGNRRQYEDMLLKLKQKEEDEKVKNEFLSNISHEFKTPINVIYSATQMQETNHLNGNLENNRKYIKSIKQNCLRLIRLVNNIIDISKIEGGYFSVTPKIINIVAQVENITDSIVDYVNSKDIELIFDTVSEEIFTFCDEDSIERIMLNLISNAIKYNKEDGQILVSIDKDDKFVHITVEDNGQGIDEEKLDIIFNRFERLDKSLSRSTEGSGIGLNLTKAIVALNKGEISAESSFDKGTKVTVKLPLAERKHFENNIKNKDVEIKNHLIERIDVEFSDIYF